MARSNSQINVAIALDTAPLEAGQRRAIKQFDKIGSVGQRASGSLKTLGKGIGNCRSFKWCHGRNSWSCICKDD